MSLGELAKQVKGLNVQEMMGKAEENEKRILHIEQLVIENNKFLRYLCEEKLKQDQKEKV